MGFRVKVPPAARASRGYLAGEDAHRLAAFQALLEDPEVDVLMAARGGYGLHRIIDQIDPERVARAAKPIVGFSDITALHLLCQKAGFSTIHGPVITQLGELPEEAKSALGLALAGRSSELVYRASGPSIQPGTARGPLIGGCLSVIAPLVGTPFLPSFDGAILLLEDVGEATYRIDRLLTHLHLAGVFRAVAGIALGEFIGCEPRRPEEQSLTEVFADRFLDLPVPVLSGLPFGHGRNNLAVPLGATVVLDADAQTLRVEAQP